jgi:lysozyme
MSDTFDLAAMTAELMQAEDRILYVYDDANGKPILPGYTVIGNPTIGTGRNLSFGSIGISMAENFLLLGNDIVEATMILDADPMWKFWRTLDAVRQRALLNLVFNLGEHGLDEFHMLCAAMQAGQWTAAGLDLENSRWWTQVGVRGPRVQHMIVTGTVPSDEPAPATMETQA